ncbi:Bestrophin, RFP-TM, chloride channel-domain-containing protein [Blastocladiella britannica]|nr:Bestrophin, RFP-TM, chloride channel-domain-containing protein [Blastocladiella britannica]
MVHAPPFVSKNIRLVNKFRWSRAMRWEGSVLPRVAMPVGVMTAWATVVYLIYLAAPSFTFPASMLMLSVLSLVLSLLLGFRTNTAYERYWEGRKLWSMLTINTRNLARLVWVASDDLKSHDYVLEKQTALSLMLTFLIAARNHTRSMTGGVMAQPGTMRMEYEGLIPPRIAESRKCTDTGALITTPDAVNSDVLMALQKYCDSLLKNGAIDVPLAGQMIAILNSLNDTMGNIDRILTTPIPLAYSVHLMQILYLYLIFLPLQLLKDFGAWSILITAITSFTMVGVEMIAGEIENPFGTDANDLKTEEFIADLEVELGELAGTARSSLADWDVDSDIPASPMALKPPSPSAPPAGPGVMAAAAATLTLPAPTAYVGSADHQNAREAAAGPATALQPMTLQPRRNQSAEWVDPAPPAADSETARLVPGGSGPGAVGHVGLGAIGAAGAFSAALGGGGSIGGGAGAGAHGGAGAGGGGGGTGGGDGGHSGGGGGDE